MVAAQTLVRSIDEAHRQLEERLHTAEAMPWSEGQPRKTYEHIDTFLAMASRHLNAVEMVLLPQVRKHVPDGGRLCHDYVRTTRELEIALANVKAREYGSALAIKQTWPEIWDDVHRWMSEQFEAERHMVSELAGHLDADQVEELSETLYQAELRAPSRPHPYAPHVGVRGRLARRVLGRVDSFWDMAEGRIIPEPPRPPHKEPGLIAQYLLADPRFDLEDEREAKVTDARRGRRGW